MAISELYALTFTSNTTEWSMTTNTAGPDTDTTDGVFQCFIELNNLAAGDTFEYKVYEKTQSGSTQRLVYWSRFSGVQGSPVWVSPSLILMHGWDMTIKKIAGTDRSISWSIRQVA